MDPFQPLSCCKRSFLSEPCNTNLPRSSLSRLKGAEVLEYEAVESAPCGPTLARRRSPGQRGTSPWFSSEPGSSLRLRWREAEVSHCSHLLLIFSLLQVRFGCQNLWVDIFAGAPRFAAAFLSCRSEPETEVCDELKVFSRAVLPRWSTALVTWRSVLSEEKSFLSSSRALWLSDRDFILCRASSSPSRSDS